MKYNHLGCLGAKVSALGLGTVNFGWVTDEAESHAILNEAVEAGINLVDTANSYNYREGQRSTEHILGRWFAQDVSRREEVVLATKVYGTVGDGPNDGKLSALHIRRACEDSLRRLQTDYIDLYQIHHVDQESTWDEIWQAMEQLVQQGKVIYVGDCNLAAWHIATANGFARQRSFLGLVSEQSIYNLIKRHVELEVIPACQSLGLGFFAYSPLAGGVLAGRSPGSGSVRRVSDEAQSEIDRRREPYHAYQEFCRELGEPPAQVALAWLLNRPGVTAPLVGPRTREQLRDSLTAMDLELSPATTKQLDEIWPGFGGPAPEAYAW